MSVDTEEMKVRGSIAAVIRRGRAAQRLYEGFTQQQVDDVVAGVAWAIAQPGLDPGTWTRGGITRLAGA
jgi:sulfoacetaldehyde dehydrogenase